MLVYYFFQFLVWKLMFISRNISLIIWEAIKILSNPITEFSSNISFLLPFYKYNKENICSNYWESMSEFSTCNSMLIVFFNTKVKYLSTLIIEFKKILYLIQLNYEIYFYILLFSILWINKITWKSIFI